jgi:hypothetical protein
MVRNRKLPPEGTPERDQVKRVAKEIEKIMVDQGKIIEGGWAGFKSIYLPNVENPNQINDMRVAFFAGCAHLFNSMMSVMDSGEEPTDKDMKRMSMIHAELADFERQFKSKHEID